MFCTQCGFELEDAHLFCPKCGKSTKPGQPAPAIPRKPLSRPIDQKMFAGVCAGFARSFNMDVTLMRVLWIVAAIVSGGLAVLVYIGAWIAMPKDYPATA
jgi:phage shock protein PspC (stress-responsive transcriptional regulator)